MNRPPRLAHPRRLLCHAATVGLALAAPRAARAAASLPDVPRSSYIVVPDDGLAAAAAAGAPTLVYLNRGGGTYRPGADDASANTSSIVKRPVTIPAWSVKSDRWKGIVQCVDGMLARWQVEVTDVDPGDVPHYEVVIGGEPADGGFADDVAGISPFSSACRSLPSAVVYAFAKKIESSDRIVCEVAVHELAHAVGLDHEYLCKDPMSYLRGCGDKTFQPVDAPCGESGPRACLCGGQTQSSVGILDARLGLAGVGNPAPTVAITAPVDGDKVQPGFSVTASATDNAAVDEVQLWVDGALSATADSAPYTFTTRKLASGTHTVEVRAIDAGGKVTARSVKVTVEGTSSDSSGSTNATGGVSTPAEDGGGCSTGGGGSTAATAALLALAMTARRRRA
jgi:uncharacterized protein (TIGR03382 family)